MAISFMVCHSAFVQRALHWSVKPDFVWVWIPIFKNYPKYIERKVLLASPHLKVQTTPYIVRSTFDGSVCKGITHTWMTLAPSPVCHQQAGRSTLVQPGEHCSVCNHMESKKEMGSEDALFLNWH